MLQNDQVNLNEDLLKVHVMVMWITIYGIVALVSATLASFIAYHKDRSANAWFASTFLFPPSLIVLLFLGKSRHGPYRAPSDEDDMKELYSD